MKAINSVMVVKESSAIEMISEILSSISSYPGLVIKIEKDSRFNSMFDLNTESIDIDISDENFLKLAKMAHEKNITLNELMTDILEEQVSRIKASNSFSGIKPKAETSYKVASDEIKNIEINDIVDKII